MSALPDRLATLVADPCRLQALRALDILDTAPEAAFDDVVYLASMLCAAPVALVSLVDEDRQWFKARHGFPTPQTGLDASVCAHVLGEPDILVFEDLAADPRTRLNPLVTGEPFIRFYAGVPLRTDDGHALGSLCVIDRAPRPGGLSREQAEGLRALARQVVTRLGERRLLAEREEALRALRDTEARLHQSEAYWRGMFERLREGLVVGRLIRDARGAVVDWRYLEVNPAWEDLIGLPAASAIGRTVRELLPDVERDWIDEPGEAVATGDPITFIRQVGQLGRWYEGRITTLGGDDFLILFLDVTDRKKTEEVLARSTRRKAALAALGDHLRAAMDVPAMSYTTAAIVGQALAASRAGYATVNAARETVLVESVWGKADLHDISGLHHFRDYGSYIDDLKKGVTVVIENVASDPRTRDHADSLRAIGIEAVVNVPVVEQGMLVAILFVHFAEPRPFGSEDELFVRAVADRACAGIARVRAEERQAVVNSEISHRLKNTLAMVQAIAIQTFKGMPDRNAADLFDKRLMALSTAHDVLLQQQWDTADLGTVACRVLDAAGLADRYVAEGPAVSLGARAALSTSLLLHELATNASKYGALTAEGGRVDLSWRLEGEGGAQDLVLQWREKDGPPVVPPDRKGFGSRLLQMGMIGTGGSQIDYIPSGLVATFRASRTQVEQA